MFELADYPLSLVFVASLVLIVAASELGHWLAYRTGDHGGDNVAMLKASILGLLALMIGFTFHLAQARFELRRDAVPNEANAIRKVESGEHLRAETVALRGRRSLLLSQHDAYQHADQPHRESSC